MVHTPNGPSSTYHGRPRATQDVDVVVETNRDHLMAFVRACAARGFYVDAEDAKDALEHRSIFNVIDVSSGYKVDIIVRAGNGDRSVVGRGSQVATVHLCRRCRCGRR